MRENESRVLTRVQVDLVFWLLLVGSKVFSINHYIARFPVVIPRGKCVICVHYLGRVLKTVFGLLQLTKTYRNSKCDQNSRLDNLKVYFVWLGELGECYTECHYAWHKWAYSESYFDVDQIRFVSAETFWHLLAPKQVRSDLRSLCSPDVEPLGDFRGCCAAAKQMRQVADTTHNLSDNCYAAENTPHGSQSVWETLSTIRFHGWTPTRKCRQCVHVLSNVFAEYVRTLQYRLRRCKRLETFNHIVPT